MTRDRILELLWRLLYTPPVYCKTCSEPMFPLWGNPSVCPQCAELLADSRNRTSSKVRVWPVESPKFRRIGSRRG